MAARRGVEAQAALGLAACVAARPAFGHHRGELPPPEQEVAREAAALRLRDGGHQGSLQPHVRIKEGERKNKAAVPLSRIELIVLGLDAIETGTYDYSPSTYGTVLDPHRFIRRYNAGAKSPPVRRTARWSGATASRDKSQRRLTPWDERHMC